MSPRQFSEAYGLSLSAVYDALRDKSLPAIKVGNRFVILWQEFEQLAQRGNDDERGSAGT